jgi:ribonuclease HI
MIVVHISDGYDVYGGRPRGGVSPEEVKPGDYGWLGNPYSTGNRKDDISSFRMYFLRRIGVDPDFRSEVLSLKGKRIACFCKPKPCHLDEVKAWLQEESTMKIYVDGSSRGNPGPASAHWHCEDKSHVKELGTHTNNYAELAAIGCALKWAAVSSGLTQNIEIHTDSQCVLLWLNGSKPKKVREKDMIVRMLDRIKVMTSEFKSCTFHGIRSEDNPADPGYK